jgi:L-lactate dehydrogenase (cytochrome)
MKRQLPKRHDLAPLMKFKKPTLSPKERRLAAALTIEDLRRIAKRRTPKAAFDYTDGAADGEVSLARAREAFGDVQFNPAILRDVSSVDTSREVLGDRVALPFGIAPTGFTRMMQTEGEIAGVTAAQAAGIPFALSTMGTTSIEDVAEAAPDARKWFQLYMWKDRERSMALVDRAKRAGYDTLLVTVDVPVAGARLRDVRNGMTIPPTLTPRTVANAIPRPAWWVNFLTTEPLAFASLDSWSGTVAELLDTMFDPTVTFETSPGSATSGPERSRSRGCSPSTTRGAWPRSASTRSCCPTTADVSWTGRRCRSTCCRRWSTRSAASSRSTSTPGSCPARTSWRLWRTGPTSPSSGARTSMA